MSEYRNLLTPRDLVLRRLTPQRKGVLIAIFQLEVYALSAIGSESLLPCAGKPAKSRFVFSCSIHFGKSRQATKDRSAMNLLTVISAGPSKFVSVLCERGDGIEA